MARNIDYPNVAGSHDRRASEVVERAIADYPDDLLRRIIDGVLADPISGVLAAQRVTDGCDQRTVSESFAFYPAMVSQDATFEYRKMLILGIRFYPFLKGCLDYGAADPVTVSKCAALIRIACAVDLHLYATNPDPESDVGIAPHFVDPTNDDSESYVILEDEAMIALALDHHSRAELIETAIRERGTVDATFLRSLLEEPNQALADGIL